MDMRSEGVTCERFMNFSRLPAIVLLLSDWEVLKCRLACVTLKGGPTPAGVPCWATRAGPSSKLVESLLPRKIDVTSKAPVGAISIVTLIRTDTTLDHSQKAEKV